MRVVRVPTQWAYDGTASWQAADMRPSLFARVVKASHNALTCTQFVPNTE